MILVTHIPANKMETIMLEADNAAHMLNLSSWEQALAKPCYLVATISGTIIETLRLTSWTLLFRLVSNLIPSVGLLCDPIRFANRFRAQKHI